MMRRLQVLMTTMRDDQRCRHPAEVAGRRQLIGWLLGWVCARSNLQSTGVFC